MLARGANKPLYKVDVISSPPALDRFILENEARAGEMIYFTSSASKDRIVFPVLDHEGDKI